MTTLNNLIDDAIEGMPPFRKHLIEKRFEHHPKAREQVVDNVLHNLAEQQEVPQLAMAIDAMSIGPDDPLPYEGDTLDKILDIIKECLPSILQLLLKFL